MSRTIEMVVLSQTPLNDAELEQLANAHARTRLEVAVYRAYYRAYPVLARLALAELAGPDPLAGDGMEEPNA